MSEIIKAGFIEIEKRVDGHMYRKGKLTVIISHRVESDGKRWYHLSLARPNKYPPYEEVMFVKNTFFGKKLKALWVLPEEKNHVNIHKYCFHMFHCPEGDGLPEFSKDGSL